MTLGLLALQISTGTAEAIKTLPEIIRAAAQSVLGILALMVLAIGILGFYLFRDARDAVKAAMFALMLAGVTAFGVASIQLQREEAARAQKQESARLESEMALRIQDLKLRLLFPPEDLANPWNATVEAYVQKKDDPSPKLRNEMVRLIRGEGGILVDFNKLDMDDLLYVVVKDGNRIWRSDDMRTPEAQLKMIRYAGR